MVTMRTRSRVAADGTVTVPVGPGEAGVEVDVTITPIKTKAAKEMTQEEWVNLLDRAARVLGDLNLVRPEQPHLEPAPEFD